MHATMPRVLLQKRPAQRAAQQQVPPHALNPVHHHVVSAETCSVGGSGTWWKSWVTLTGLRLLRVPEDASTNTSASSLPVEPASASSSLQEPCTPGNTVQRFFLISVTCPEELMRIFAIYAMQSRDYPTSARQPRRYS